MQGTAISQLSAAAGSGMLSYTGSDSSSCVPQVRAVLLSELAGGARLVYFSAVLPGLQSSNLRMPWVGTTSSILTSLYCGIGRTPAKLTAVMPLVF